MLEGANIKISSILSNVTGKTCLSLIEYVLENKADIDDSKAKELVTTRISASIEEVDDAMEGIITPFQKTMIKEVIKHINELTDRIKDMDKIITIYMKETLKNF